MEFLDNLATSIGRSACDLMGGGRQDTLFQVLCSDGTYSAGWKLIVSALVLLGVALAWAGLGPRRSRR